ncbi:alpha/beta hydrolase, partial [Mycobacterium sp. ITM-2017-0098]
MTVGATLATLAGCGGAAAEQAPSEQPAPADLPTVVLVHGAFADSSSWNGVIESLKRDGYPVIAAA